ncbi:MAG: ATP-binding protein [Phenylobacterium sp.]
MTWHLLWTGTVAAAGGAMIWRGVLRPGADVTTLAALTIGAVAALLGALLAATGTGVGRVLAIILWAVGAALAVQLTGGTLGPLAPWCLAPLAAAAAFRRPQLLSVGAAAAVATAAVSAMGALLLPLPVPSADGAVWLSLLALATTALGLGAGLVALQGEVRGAARAGDAAQARLREMLDQQPQLLLDLNPGGRVVAAFGETAMGLEGAALVGHHFVELAAPEHRLAVEDALQRAAAKGSAEVAFMPAHDPAGWFVLTLRRMSAERMIAAVRDGRGQRAREAELERARASAESQNAGKSRFLANMSHELRTPLNAIMGFSDIMRQHLFGPLSDRYVNYAELIHESGSHLLELINDVLDMSKIEAERFELSREDFDARDAVNAVLRLMRGQADRAGIHLRGVVPPKPLPAEADRRAIKQIALNLISNALKFTPRGGSVTLTAQAWGDVLELVVADTGVGIPPEDLARLGRPFEQAGDAHQRAAGAGLGLSLVRAFAKLHGGEMTIESRVGDGTTVTVRMPVLREEPETAEDADATSAPEVSEVSEV